MYTHSCLKLQSTRMAPISTNEFKTGKTFLMGTAYTYIPTRTHTFTHAYTHTHTYIHTRTHTHTHRVRGSLGVFVRVCVCVCGGGVHATWQAQRQCTMLICCSVCCTVLLHCNAAVHSACLSRFALQNMSSNEVLQCVKACAAEFCRMLQDVFKCVLHA